MVRCQDAFCPVAVEKPSPGQQAGAEWAAQPTGPAGLAFRPPPECTLPNIMECPTQDDVRGRMALPRPTPPPPLGRGLPGSGPPGPPSSSAPCPPTTGTPTPASPPPRGTRTAPPGRAPPNAVAGIGNWGVRRTGNGGEPGGGGVTIVWQKENKCAKAPHWPWVVPCRWLGCQTVFETWWGRTGAGGGGLG